MLTGVQDVHAQERTVVSFVGGENLKGQRLGADLVVDFGQTQLFRLEAQQHGGLIAKGNSKPRPNRTYQLHCKHAR